MSNQNFALATAKIIRGLKTSMPNGWDLNVTEYDWSIANPYARLDFAGIQLAQQTINNSIRNH
jgi:hypothetical protein